MHQITPYHKKANRWDWNRPLSQNYLRPVGLQILLLMLSHQQMDLMQFGRSFFPSQDLSLLQKSGVRALWSKLRETPAASSDASGSKPDTSTSADNSWSDIFPPKLSSWVISNLKQSFSASEVLTNETCPSTRLLSLVYHHVQKKDVRWIEWKYRMSISKADDQAIQRAPKVARAENLQLHQMLLDEPGSIEISNQSMGLNSMRVMFELRNYAWALAREAHLHRLRA